MNARLSKVHGAQAQNILPSKFESVATCRRYRRAVLAAAPTTKHYLAEKCTPKKRCNSGLCPLCIRALRERFVEFLHQERLHEREWFFVTAYIQGWTKKPGDLRAFGKLSTNPAIKAFVQRLRRLELPNLVLFGAIETVWRTNENKATGKPFHLHFMISGPSETQVKEAADRFGLDTIVRAPLKVVAVPRCWEDFRNAATYTVKQPFWKYSYHGLGPRKKRQFPNRRELGELICNLGPHSTAGRLAFAGMQYKHGRFELTPNVKSMSAKSQVEDGSNNPADAEKRPPNEVVANLIGAIVATLRAENWAPQPLEKRQSTTPSAKPVPPCTGSSNNPIRRKSVMSAQGTPREARAEPASTSAAVVSQPKRFLKLQHVEIHEPKGEYFVSVRFSKRKGIGEALLERYIFANAGQAAKELLKLGAVLPEDFKARCEAILNNSTAREIHVVQSGGWFGDAFLCPYGVFGRAPSVANVRLHHSLVRERTVKGDRQDFLDGIRPFLLKSDFLILAYVAALLPSMASRLRRSESFGLNLAGDSSTGKTTALVLAQSLITHTTEKSLFNINTPQATLTNSLTSFGGLAVPFLDLKAASEKGQKIVEKIQTTIFNMVTGKGRENPSSAGLRAASFCIPVFSSEKPMSELFEKGGVEYQVGDAVRLIDVPVPKRDVGGIYNRRRQDESTADLAKNLEDLLALRHGQIFPAWIKKLSSMRHDGLKFVSIVNEADFIASVTATEGAHRRIANHFSRLYAAGDLASAWGLIPLKRTTIKRALVRLYNSAIGQLVIASNRDEQVRERLYAAIDSYPLLCKAKADESPSRSVDGFRREEKDGQRLYIKHEALKKLVNDDWCLENTILKELVELDALVGGSGARSRHVKQAGLKRARYLAIRLARLDR